MEYGLPVRRFDSFLQAGNEAGINKLYAGIHCHLTIAEGQKQG